MLERVSSAIENPQWKQADFAIKRTNERRALQLWRVSDGSDSSPVDGSINTVIRANVGQGGRDAAAAAMISGSAICQQDSKESYLSGNGKGRFYNNKFKC